MYMCAVGIDYASVFTIFRLNFGSDNDFRLS